ncbi:MAG: hypothetical protein EBQ73_02185 [Gammaproteobacteria bacterium]|nr:hypothetical protein [Gammaproteobacteria bacterium]
MQKNTLALLVVIAVVTISGYFLNVWHQGNVRKNLVERINQYWVAKQVNDVRTIYEMESAKLDGTMTPSDANYYNSGNVYVNSFEVEDIQYQDDSAIVTINRQLTFDDLQGKEFSNRGEDRWILIEGQWYHDSSKAPSAQGSPLSK